MWLLSGCAGLDPYQTPPPSTPPSVGEPADDAPVPPTEPGTPEPDLVPPGPVAPKPAGPAAHLLEQALRLSARREFDQAAAQVERALRIERNNPWLYLALADIRLAQRDTQQAAVLVQKARSLSRGDPAVLRDAEALSLRNPDRSMAP